jgi:hypothetical protein
MTEHKVSCFYGTQDKSYDIESTKDSESQGLKSALIERHGESNTITESVGEKSNDTSLVQLDDSVEV